MIYRTADAALKSKVPGAKTLQCTCREAMRLAGIETTDVEGRQAWFTTPTSMNPGQDINSPDEIWNVAVSTNQQANLSSIAATISKYPALAG